MDIYKLRNGHKYESFFIIAFGLSLLFLVFLLTSCGDSDSESSGIQTQDSFLSCPDNNHPHLIDLGLPSGTKWACCNLGASSPEQYGNYYAWGETRPKDSYMEENYAFSNSSTSDFDHIGTDITGTKYDAAMANWGTFMVMPSLDQIKELLNHCTSEWTTLNGVGGRKFTGPSGGFIFIPAAGSRWRNELYNAGDWGIYWSSTLGETSTNYAFVLAIRSKNTMWSDDVYRFRGQSVRPVRKK